ncbi:hypothetical protein FTO70_03355 [Methanosarcina sp. KYL-1]|uniref:hypothetical protein n=1 Tax=Methanosarcina sp. KYL-1 TaxID=2602068 RepID=UPI0021007931|nr:hypothetical protein [Methanosarcina sp. KYL-1]MCQ1534743.1 hypothetical protein [Methanosarcina sp. KYL-1]
MEKLKLVLTFLLLLIIIVGGIFVTGGGSFIVTYPSDYSSEIYTEFEERSLIGDVFLEEVWAYDDHFAFLFIPKASNATANYYFSFEIKENGTTLESAEKIYYEEVSTHTPIIMRVPKKPDTSYEIEVLIEDEDGVEVHKSKTRIGPQKQEP